LVPHELIAKSFKFLINMKSVFITIIGFILLSIVTVLSCNTKKDDTMRCGGACPGTLTCQQGVCKCPEGATQISAVDCIFRSGGLKSDATGGYNVTYLPDSNSNCFFKNVTFTTYLFDTTNFFKTVTGGGVTPITDDDMRLGLVNNTLGTLQDMSLNNLESCGFYKDNQGRKHWDFILSPFKGNCNCSIWENNLKAEGVFSPKFDSLYITYYTSCCNGAIRDTCHETRYLL
jgi:hypothetical protein